jgi:predicted flap endonuclease-1-like 5' DNA nuclease
MQVALEKAEVRPVAVPETGLCMPTPAADVREEESCQDRCFCACCQSNERITDAITMETEAGRPVQVGRCANCGTELVRFGGPQVLGAPRFTLAREPAQRPAIFTRSTVTLATTGRQIERPAPRSALTDIEGVGEARARRLIEAGIDSPAKLAATPAERVVELLAPGVSEEMAAKFIEDAARLASSHQTPSPPPTV